MRGSLGWACVGLMVLASLSCESTPPSASPVAHHDDETVGVAEDGPGTRAGAIRVEVSFAGVPGMPGVSAKLLGIAVVDGARAYVYDSGGSSIADAQLTIADDTASGRITVPPGDNYRVAVTFSHGDTLRYVGEDDDVDVPAGGTATASVTARFVGVSPQAPSAVGADGSYTVSWPEVDEATGYRLEEATSSGFGDARVVYTGAGTEFSVSERTGSDDYYYRVRAQTSYGWGPWAGYAVVSVGQADGEILIEADVPCQETGECEGTPASRAQALLGYWRFLYTVTTSEGDVTYRDEYHLQRVTSSTNDSGEYYVEGVSNLGNAVNAVYCVTCQNPPNVYFLFDMYWSDVLYQLIEFTIDGDLAEGRVYFWQKEGQTIEDAVTIPLLSGSGRATGFTPSKPADPTKLIIRPEELRRN